jgi:hypothetical protein
MANLMTIMALSHFNVPVHLSNHGIIGRPARSWAPRAPKARGKHHLRVGVDVLRRRLDLLLPIQM